jgi:hypothetical protein
MLSTECKITQICDLPTFLVDTCLLPMKITHYVYLTCFLNKLSVPLNIIIFLKRQNVRNIAGRTRIRTKRKISVVSEVREQLPNFGQQGFFL